MGEVDCTALGKAIILCLFGMCMFAHYWSWLTFCGKFGDAFPGFYDKNHYNIATAPDYDKGVEVEAYLAVWACVFVASIVGVLCMLAGSAKFGRVYAMGLIAAWLWISIQDYVGLGHMVSYYQDEIDNAFGDDAEAAVTAKQNAWGFLIAGLWFGETFILFNTAWDAANRDDVERKYQD